MMISDTLFIDEQFERLPELERTIGYTFRGKGLLVEALTHRSVQGPHNERLEFLGDSVLDLYVGKELMQLLPGAAPGQLASTRAGLVCEAALHERAAEIGLLSYIRARTAITRRMLADCMEAVIGAAWLDGGFPAVSLIDLTIKIVRLPRRA